MASPSENPNVTRGLETLGNLPPERSRSGPRADRYKWSDMFSWKCIFKWFLFAASNGSLPQCVPVGSSETKH